MRKIAHIINPVIVNEASDLFVAQPITFTTMATARDFARDTVNVALYTAQYSEDRTIIPPEFQTTPDLERSTLDLGPFQKKRKLPLIKDILDRLYEAAPEAEYCIYTNVDIALLPQFYIAVNRIIEDDYDAFIINRRTITNTYKDINEIPLMYAEVGESHKGWDCFVFKREAYPRFMLGDICVGANLIGTVLLFNLLCTSKNFMEFKDKHLTFHLGDDMTWKNKDFSDYSAHNIREAYRIYEEIEKTTGNAIAKDGRFNGLVKWFLDLKKELDEKDDIARLEGIKPVKKEESLSLSTKQQRALCVTGMARCGTSMVARMLNIMGLYLGPEDSLIRETGYNVKGCWEHRTLLEISDEIVTTIKDHEFQRNDWLNSPIIPGLEEKAKATIAKDFEGAQLWGWKDDRCAVTLPFWKKLLPDLEYVICVRNPEDAVKSLLKARMIPTYEIAVFKWLIYLTSAIKNTEGSRRLIVFYEDFLGSEWKSAVRKLAEFLGPSHTNNLPQYEKEIESFISRDLQHHSTSINDLLHNPRTPYVVKHFYSTLYDTVKGTKSAGFIAPNSEADKIIADVAAYANDEAYRMISLIYMLHARNKQAEDPNKEMLALNMRIDDLLNSYSWRMTAPLRRALDTLRRLKKKQMGNLS